MARRAKSRPSLYVRNLIVNRVRQGYSWQDAVNYVKSQHRFQRYNFRTMGDIARQAVAQLTATQRVTSADKRRTVDIGVLGGCGPGAAVRMRIEVSYTDAETGHIRYDGYTVDNIRGRGRVRDFISRAVEDVLQHVYRYYPGRYAIQDRNSDPNFGYNIAYVECQ